MFKPVLLYTLEVWGAYDKMNLDKWEQDPVECFQLSILSWIKQKGFQFCRSKGSWANIFKTHNLFEHPQVLATFRRTTRK